VASGLSAYIREVRGRPFQPGVWDCVFFAGEWVRRLTGRDLTAPWDGQAQDEESARRIIEDAGGLVALIDRGSQGVLRRCAPDRAIVGVLDGDGEELAAIRAGAAWVVLTPGGIGRTRKHLCIAAWGL